MVATGALRATHRANGDYRRLPPICWFWTCLRPIS